MSEIEKLRYNFWDCLERYAFVIMDIRQEVEMTGTIDKNSERKREVEERKIAEAARALIAWGAREARLHTTIGTPQEIAAEALPEEDET